jgi:hypothetical protein
LSLSRKEASTKRKSLTVEEFVVVAIAPFAVHVEWTKR